MKIDTASHLVTSNHQQTSHALSPGESKEPRIMQIEAEDAFEAVLLALRLQSEPTIVLLPEKSRAFNDPSHFAQLREISPPDQVSFVLPQNRLGTLVREAHQYGFVLTSSLQKALQLFPSHEQAKGMCLLRKIRLKQPQINDR